jgi:hypothetical protein
MKTTLFVDGSIPSKHIKRSNFPIFKTIIIEIVLVFPYYVFFLMVDFPYLNHITLWLFNIAMENGPFIDGDFPCLC